METIRTYLDNVFAAFPQTDEVKTLKREMLTNMEEKYLAFRQAGKSEHDAAYSVIADFGNMDEIVAELGGQVDLSKPESETRDIFLSWEEATNYIRVTRNYGVKIGLGVWIIMIGVATLIAGGTGGLFTLFVAIAVGVALFITSGYKVEKYEKYEETPIRLDEGTRNAVEDLHARHSSRFGAKIALGVVVILVTVGAFVSFDFIQVPFLLIMIGFAVFIFVSVCTVGEAFEVLLNIGDYEKR